MDELKNQLDFTVNPDKNEPEQEGGVMDDCNSGSGSDSKSGSINRKSSKKNRLKIRIKMRKSEDCNGESGTISNETRSITMNHVSGGAKNRVKAEHHGCTRGEGIVELPNYGKRRRFMVKTQLKNHRRRSKLRLINLEFTNMEEKAWSGESVTDESSEENDDDSSPAKPICSLCGKNFPSMKSLFGHMRCHPDRDWRGMVPPEKNSSPSSAVSDSGPDFTRNREEKTGDQVSSLLGWSVTARRGRRSTISESSELSDDQISYAAYHLMMLAYADSGEENRKESEGRNMEFGNLGCSEEVKRRKTEKTNCVFGSKTVKKIGENKLVYRSEQRKRKRKIRTLEKVQNLGLIDSNLNAVLAQKYRCSTCSKSFSSHQALGGHRASHKKRRNTSYPLRGVDEFTVDEVAEEEDSLMADLTHMEHSPETGNEPCPEVDTVHRCQICNRGFPTGQALGGHKRCHWTGARSTMADLAAASSVTSVIIPKDGRKSALGLPDFDLNKPPMVEEEDLDSAVSTIDVVHASLQPPGLNSKDHGLVYCNYVI